MYRTGDLGRWMADGTIEFLGRNDFQVKIRGFRIELGEIEASLAGCEGVDEAVVIACEDGPGEPQLVAYYLGDQDVAAGSLREHLSKRLPEYMLPSAFVRLETWPLTTNGKLDRKALPVPGDDAYARRAYAAPEGEIEQALARIWSELLGIERVGRDDNFFELGGHSLLAVQLISRLHNAFHVEVPLRAVFESPTLSQLAERIAQADASQLSAIAVVERETFMPLSLAQQRLWVLTQIDGASAAYHMGGALKLEGALDRDALHRALQRIVDRHEALRTQFVLVDGQPMQAIMAEARIVPSIHDLRDRVDREAACRSFSDAFMTTPFDLRHDLPLRVQLIQLEDHVHELQVVMHHIVSDGWSIGIMLNELSRLYAADVQGQADPLPALPIQYVDYSQWQRQWLAEGQLARQTTFWQHNLAGAPTLLELPTDRRRPAQQDFLGDAVDVRLEAALTASLKALSQRHGVTLYMTLLASWAAVLGRLSNQDEVVIGSPVAGRNRAEVESLIGFFVNTLALRIDLRDAPSVSALLMRVKQQVLEAQAHQDLPFDQMVEAIKPPRSMAHAPIFQVMLVWQNQAEAKLEMPGVEVSSVGIRETTAQLDLTLSLGEIDGEIVGGLNYATALFNRETVVRYAQYWTRLLQGMVADPASLIAGLPMLGKRERECIIDTWNDTARDYPAYFCVHQLLEVQVARTPEATALVFGERRIRYGELNARANQLAHVLRTLGVGRDTLVAVAVERGIEMIVTLLGILKAGGAYVPVASDAPAERLAFMLSDAKPLLLLTDVATRFDDTVIDTPMVSLDALGPQLAQCPQTSLGSDGYESSQLAYVIYTSGTTGTPKGVLVSQRNLINVCYWCQDVGLFKAGERMTQFVPFTFDVSALEIFGGLLAGVELHLLEDTTIQDPAALQRYLTAHAIQFSTFPPAYLQQMDPDEVPIDLRVHTGGSAPTLDLVKRWAGRGHYLNGYGPTETTILSTSAWLSAEADTITIGKPIANTQVYLLDAQRQPVPIGAIGEIHIGGDGVALGYLNRPELTAELFLDDPFSAVAGARMYKTGDLGRWMTDGTIEFLGRNDFQVKIRGFRIELGEIEVKLCALPGIREAVVIAREGGPSEQSLVAYYLGDQNSAAASLREQLSQHLPEYMLPSAFVRLETWPLTRNGKLDRKALPVPEEVAYARRVYAAPEGEAEQMLAQIWSELLGIERVGRYDDFFELGGHSLVAVSMIHQLRRKGLHADIRALFTTSTLAGFAVELSRGYVQIPAPPNLIPEITDRIAPEMLAMVSLEQSQINALIDHVQGGACNVQDIYPLSSLQEGMLFHHILEKNDDIYITLMMLSFPSRSRVESFISAMQRVIDRHDALRTSFFWEKLTEPLQVVQRKALLQYRELRLDSTQGPVKSQLKEYYNPTGFHLDISVAPLMQLCYAHDPVLDRWMICAAMHHLICDHTALDTMREEAWLIQQGRELELQKPTPYRNYIWQTKVNSDPAAHDVFFTKMLNDIDQPVAPFGLEYSGVNNSGICNVKRTLSAGLANRILREARKLGVGAAAVMHAAWALVLARATGMERIVFGTVLFGRMDGGDGADRAVGLLINTLPIKIDLAGYSASEIIKNTQTALADLLLHENASLVLAKRCSRLPATVELFSALMNYRHSQRQSPLNDDIVAEDIEAAERTNYPISLSVDDLGDGFCLSVQTELSVGAERVCDYMQAALIGILDALESDISTPVRYVDVMPVMERAQIVFDWNDAVQDYPQKLCMHQLFEAHAAAEPDAVAVTCGVESMTYSQLNSRAERMASMLRAQGIGPDVLVGICMSRSASVVQSILAVLKAGGAYLPLDPINPVDRLGYMLEDAAPRVVLTDASSRSVLLKAIELAPSCAPTLFDINSDAQLLANHVHGDTDGSLSVCKPEHLAYVIYTSGSTGKPKGVMVEHRHLGRLFDATGHHYRFGPNDVWMLFHSYAFDFSVWEMWGALRYGGRLVVVPAELSRSTDDTYALICAHGVTVLNQTPSVFSALCDAQRRSADSHSIRHVIFGGEALDPRTLKAWFADARNADARMTNMYGITETTVHTTFYELSPVDVERDERSPIGTRIDDVRLYVLDTQMMPCPHGVVGELYVGGAGVARGYLNRPELTAERFVENPFFAGDRLYRSGDLCRWLSDGTLDYIGRNDTQVKIRGYRIELGEIEAKLSLCDGVRDAVVIARNDSSGEKHLVAYYLSDIAPDAARLREQLSSWLPGYMLPSAFVRMEDWPLTANGKLDRNALPMPEGAAYAQHAYVAPKTDLEFMLAQVWEELLGVKRIGMHDNFFALGGHSLLAIRLQARLASDSNSIDFSLLELYRSPTIAGLVCIVESRSISTSTFVPVLSGSHRRNPELTLICVPYAGASTSVFLRMAEALSLARPNVCVRGVSLPGREIGSAGTGFDSIELAAKAIAEEVSQSLDGPIALYGHCVGSVLAIELAWQLERQQREVSFLALGGVLPMSRIARMLSFLDPWSMTSDESIVVQIRKWGLELSDVEPEVLRIMMRTFRKDAKIAARHMRRNGDKRVLAPIINIISDDDPLTRNYLREHIGWRRISSDVKLEIVSGGKHYFAENKPKDVARILNACIAARASCQEPIN
ncbi:MAG: amino acid adenylation domain-containing protein [Sphingorhabdus sp.]